MSLNKPAFFAAALLMAAPVWAINKCKTPEGKTVFQDAPCAGQGEKIEVRPASGYAVRAPVSAASAPAPAATTPPLAPAAPAPVAAPPAAVTTPTEN